jgi:hypothetical protein
MDRQECLARAEELEAKMTATPSGLARDGYAELAAQWRVLADIADHEQRKAQKPASDPEKPE